MLYLSDIVGKRIVDHRNNRVAKVRDVVAEVLVETRGPDGDLLVWYQPSPGDKEQVEAIERDAPVVKGLVARTGRRNQPFYVPLSQIESFGPGKIRLKSAKLDLQPFQ